MSNPHLTRIALGILDLSEGPTGLSRYIELLWPTLSQHFRVIVFGDPRGPYTNLPADRFVSIFASGSSTSSYNRPSSAEPVPPAVENVHSVRGQARSAWRRLAPAPARWACGFTRDAWSVGRALKPHAIDVLYTPVCGAEITVLAARFAGIRRVVGTIHHMPPAESAGSVNRAAARFTCRGLKAAIAVSGQIARSWIHFVPSLSGKTEVIPNGVQIPVPTEPRRTRGEVLAGFGLPTDGRPVFIAVGRLSHIKGFGYLVDAVSKLRPRYPGLTIGIAGQGPLAAELEEAIHRHGIQDNIRLLGQVENVSSLLAAADGFVLSSIKEAMPFALLEAMAHGLPVVATAVGGVPELVRHGETGLLCSPADSGRLADGIETLLMSPEMAKSLGRAGQEAVRQSYSVEAMAQATLEVFRRSMRGREV